MFTFFTLKGNIVKFKTLSIILTTIAIFLCPVINADTGLPVSRMLSLSPPEPNPAFSLSELDMKSIQEEDREDQAAGLPLRIGVFRELPQITADDGEFYCDSDYGLIWQIQIASAGAYQLRLKVENLDIPANGVLYVYNESQTESEMYRRQGPYSAPEIWTWATPGDSVVIEWHQPGWIPEDVSTLPFYITGLSHAYRDQLSVFNEKRAGACHNDVTCDSEYQAERAASAFIEFQDGGDWYICSGTMLNNSNQDCKPYFITANHCIPNQTIAQTIQTYFYFTTSTCDAGHANHGVVKNGSTLKATGTSSDFSLLELTPTDYPNVYFAGWDRNTVNNGEYLSSIHHPDGTYRRISYGSRGSGSYSNMWEVVWDRTDNPGVTEPGSSGGGLFRDSNHYFIGQLYGGTSACDNQLGPDYYGKFSQSFSASNLGTWLGNSTTLGGRYFTAQPTPTPRPPTATPPATNTPIPTYTPTAKPGQPTNTPIPTWTPTPTPTHTPTAPPGQPTYTPHPTNTPIPSWTPGPSPTPTPYCNKLGCTIYMPDRDLGPGDDCACELIICNTRDESFFNTPVIVLLEVADQFYFLPDYTLDFAYLDVDVKPGRQTIKILESFQWPSGAGAYDDARWYAGMTNAEMTDLFGDIDILSFSWHE